jgi:transcriptional regulator with XRE-family HTH domain
MVKQDAASGPGVALRELRLRRGATLKDFSELTGLPVSTLSKLETGKLGMSYQRLLKLSQSLGVDLTALIRDLPETKPREAAPALGRREITRANEGPMVKTQVYEYRYPASELVRKTLNPMIMDITARSINEFEDLMRHPGEEYALVTEGAVDFYSDHYKPTRLEKGDSIYFDGNMGHAYVAVLETPCRLLAVCSAPPEELIESRTKFEKKVSKLTIHRSETAVPGTRKNAQKRR